MSASVLNLPSSGWIISRRNDLFFFIGSALFGYLLIAACYKMQGLPPLFLILYAFGLDGPHVFSTLTRALLDPHERSRLRWLWIVMFPLCVTSIFTFAVLAGVDWSFIVVAALSTYHISKQHMGFVMIYRAKARERERFKLDKYFTLASLLLPYAYYLSALITGGRIPLAVFLVPAIGLTVFYSIRTFTRSPINVPKIALLAAFIPLQWFAWTYAAAAPHSIGRLVGAGIAINVGHSLQYLRLMYFHNHNRYSDRQGLLSLVSRRPIYFVFAAIVLALPNFLSTQILSLYLSALVVGMLLFHFLLDAKIWRIRGDRELAQALKL